ncbi:uncharacterized protein [Watersipora subatra]|uniref:uncharacterized protein n=1 Tax=Watersipora subatra TaxID=2589382 RepID=UPI00355AD9B0
MANADSDDLSLFDALVIYHHSDADLVDTFIEELKQNVHIDDHELVISCLSDALPANVSKYQALDQVSRDTTFLIVFVSQTYTSNSEAYDKFLLETSVDSSLERDEDSVLPVWVDWKNDRKPFVLKRLNGVKYSTGKKEKNMRAWKTMQKTFDGKTDEIRERRLKRKKLEHKKKLKEMTWSSEHLRLREEQASEVKHLQNKPIPKPRCRVSTNGLECSREQALRPVVATDQTGINITVNVNIGQGDESVLVGAHQPSLPGSSLDTTIHDDSTVDLRTPSDTKTHGTSTGNPASPRVSSGSAAETVMSPDGNMIPLDEKTNSAVINSSLNTQHDDVISHSSSNVAHAEEYSYTLCFSLPDMLPNMLPECLDAMHSSSKNNQDRSPTSPLTQYASEMNLPSTPPDLATESTDPSIPLPLSANKV